MTTKKSAKQYIEKPGIIPADGTNIQIVSKTDDNKNTPCDDIQLSQIQQGSDKEKDCKDNCLHCGLHCIYLNKD